MKIKKKLTPHEKFWKGSFGNKYSIRNNKKIYLESNRNFFNMALKKAKKINSCVELGAGTGNNVKCLKKKFPSAKLQVVEINNFAIKFLEKIIEKKNIFNESILKWKTNKKFDLVLVKGVLIHMPPNKLKKIYNLLFKLSKKYILICEYYNPTPVTVAYRGHKYRLFKRDFAGEILKRFKKLKLVDYGFVYRNDPKYPLDDLNWFLLKK